MIKTLLKGLIFGIGFITAIFIAGYVGLNYFSNDLADINKKLEIWNSLTEEGKIKASSAIIVVRFSEGEDNVRLASISNIYTKPSSASTDLKVGQLYPKANYYPLSNDENRSASILLFMSDTDSPTTTWHAYNEIIPAVGNMPVELLIKKFKE
ncbi:hypothetical protein [Amphritea japonica]|uniref:Uncharacterized protein n=1 Tax=Amphritea japonica ATCC BAA-1530 TaxID=1278309 RepID=A0A7R6PMZ3_9GAMM|nr:hypothetical protein [Amphritea japonica]BBB26338.1 hypothetical protein AMJAP_1743 [Amphritea japonica ATCC BAA-1530]